MSLAGPTLIAVDQIDAIVSASNAASRTNGNGATQEQEEAQSIVEALANGLIDLHEKKRRAVTVISCLEATWRVLQDKTVVSVTDRYSSPAILHALPSGDIAKGLIAARLSKAYASAGFEPPYPTWPFTDAAFESAVGFSPRQLLKACEQHRQNCIASGEVTECETFAPAEELPKPKPVVDNELDLILAAEFDMASADGLLDAENEDRLQELLDPTLRLFEKHFDLPEDIDSVAQPDSEQKRPALHGRLTFIFRNEGDREQHYCFRGLSHTNANAFQSRLKAAMTASGIDQALGFRHLFILRRGAPPGGAKTKQLIDQFTAAGGRFIVPTEDDLRGMIALREMAGRDLPNFDAWLRARRPLFDSGLLQAAGLCPPPFLRDVPAAQSSNVARPVTAAVAPAKLDETPPPAANPAKGNGKVQELAKAISRSVARVLESPFLPRSVPIGRRFDSGIYGDAVRLDANLLSRHMAILAGTGSGKTVLLRRIVEEAALLKIPAIVLDINNDLARLGEMWPVPPEGFSDQDASKAADYHSRTEVVVWTPGVSSGNPISLNLLPDFAAIGDKQDSQTEDERSQAVEMARATIGPYVGGGGQKAQLRQGVLADVLRVFARGGGGTLDDLIALLSELPEEASRISDAPKLAAEIANQLLAAVATNPLLQSAGQPLDPHYLFHGDKDKTRISVINLSGLASEEARQAFVNQLQMTLFTWIKRHPSPTGRLYVLDEAQNFAPSQLVTACKRSALSLVAQARKYGLGMIFATQLPKGIDNAIVSNCTTHVYGRMSAPATIQATQELMAAKGGAADDLARLTRGEFYFSTEGFLKPLKVRTPLCLSWHPPNPPTAEEVIQRARAKRSNVVAASRAALETTEQQLPLFAIGDRDIEAVQGD
jgi:hypothetical protein